MRIPVVAGNWKMNPSSLADALGLAESVAAAASDLAGIETVVCPPTIWLGQVAAALTGSRVAVGAQTMHWEERGAFTGETSPQMLAGVARFVIIGHSERRQYDGETDERVGRKVAAAVAHRLRPIAAVGERAEERRRGETAAVIERQVRAAIAGLSRLAGSGLVIAYEPVWAIGTGDAASGGDAQDVATQIRGILRDLDTAGAEEVPIQYGGSVTDANADEFFSQSEIDGALVGGASLKRDTFTAILRSAASAASAA
jgi:triosephosphate isomerase